jgi:hypothetical protein
MGALAMAGCGESAQDKAKAQVCNARADIAKQINTLTGFTLSSSSVNAAKTALETIGKDLTQIKNAQSKRKIPLHPEVIRLNFLD